MGRLEVGDRDHDGGGCRRGPGGPRGGLDSAGSDEHLLADLAVAQTLGSALNDDLERGGRDACANLSWATTCSPDTSNGCIVSTERLTVVMTMSTCTTRLRTKRQRQSVQCASMRIGLSNSRRWTRARRSSHIAGVRAACGAVCERRSPTGSSPDARDREHPVAAPARATCVRAGVIPGLGSADATLLSAVAGWAGPRTASCSVVANVAMTQAVWASAP